MVERAELLFPSSVEYLSKVSLESAMACRAQEEEEEEEVVVTESANSSKPLCREDTRRLGGPHFRLRYSLEVVMVLLLLLLALVLLSRSIREGGGSCESCAAGPEALEPVSGLPLLLPLLPLLLEEEVEPGGGRKILLKELSGLHTTH